MSWHSDMTAEQKAQYILLRMTFDDLDSKLKFPLPRGAFSYGERPGWYDGVPLQEVVRKHPVIQV